MKRELIDILNGIKRMKETFFDILHSHRIFKGQRAQRGEKHFYTYTH